MSEDKPKMPIRYEEEDNAVHLDVDKLPQNLCTVVPVKENWVAGNKVQVCIEDDGKKIKIKPL